MKVILNYLIAFTLLFVLSCNTTPVNTIQSDIPQKPIITKVDNTHPVNKMYNEVCESIVEIINPNGGYGTGFVYSNEIIMTASHVVKSVKSKQLVQVILRDDTSILCEVIGIDEKRDIALLMCVNKAQTLPKPIKLNKGNMVIGETVFVIGHPRGLSYSLSKGIISNIRNDIRLMPLIKLIQTDAAINPGNSGGVMLNEKGELIAVISFIYSTSTGHQGLNFGIHLDEVTTAYGLILDRYIKKSKKIEKINKEEQKAADIILKGIKHNAK